MDDTEAERRGGLLERLVGTQPLTYCPYCGSASIKIQRLVPRCGACRAVFFVTFSRFLRMPPKKPNAELTGVAADEVKHG